MEHNETLTKASYSRIEKKHSSYYVTINVMI